MLVNITLGLGPLRHQQLKDRPGRPHWSLQIEHAGAAFYQAGGSCSELELGDTLSPRAGNLGGEMVDASQYGQALSCTIDTSQVLATVDTEDFSSTNPQDSSSVMWRLYRQAASPSIWGVSFTGLRQDVLALEEPGTWIFGFPSVRF